MWKRWLTISLLRIYRHLAVKLKRSSDAWVDDLTGRLQRELKGRFTNTPRKSSCSVWQKRTAHDTSCDDDGGWKETSGRIVASEAIESNPVKTPTRKPNSRHRPLVTRKLVAVADNVSTYCPKVCPVFFFSGYLIFAFYRSLPEVTEVS
jgi:hypothetical protein